MKDNNPYHPFVPPFHGDSHGMIWDSENNHFADIRGWGWLSGRGSGALHLSNQEAEYIMERNEKKVVELLNKDFESCQETRPHLTYANGHEG